ncbi:M20 metallopeptidase family protein [Clostridium oryzae]|uniref:Putative hydrolase YxeP n=1 Tax=Clostridium oryzae TaxID=1450648 RepID=A0A1V4IAJ9_9CLOT|nr:amidohydrolase [Clostridium oryzae]OPJ56547.1 putative hydrolase YxeP [Clostridium oryzae]
MYKFKINQLANSINNELINIRRDIHAHPESGLEEFRTSALVASILSKLNLEVKTNIGETGVVGLLKGKFPGKTIMLRADMDCLKINELNELSYKSLTPGYMHACGHDAHTTWLLGAAMILSKFKDELHGNVKFVFQPAEETVGGAERMIKAGVLDNPKVDAVIGAHAWPDAPSGCIAVRYGAMMAAPDRFKITIIGKGGHGAAPHLSVDPIAIACEVYSGIQNIISRQIDQLEPVLISICRFNSGSSYNIVPDTAELEGTVRTFSNDIRDSIPKLMERKIKGICDSSGATYKLDYTPYYPPVINNDDMNALLEEVGHEMFGEGNVIKLSKPVMIGEDFSNFQQNLPSTFFGVGTYNEEKGIVHSLHSPNFNIDEDILPKASSVFALYALRYLNGHL